MNLLILLIFAWWSEHLFSPRLEYLCRSNMWVCWYNSSKNKRDFFVVWRD